MQVGNLSQALSSLQAQNYAVIGLDIDGRINVDSLSQHHFFQTDTQIPTKFKFVVVLGAEGDGLRQKTKQLCDLLLTIDHLYLNDSMNVSNAAAIVLYQLRHLLLAMGKKCPAH